MESRIEEVPRAIAREHAPGAVRAVSPRREAHDHEARLRIAEAGNRAPPVLPVAVHRALLAGDALAPRDEARARAAPDDLVAEDAERGTRRRLLRLAARLPDRHWPGGTT